MSRQMKLVVGGREESKKKPRVNGFERGTLVKLNEIAWARRIGSYWNRNRPGVVVQQRGKMVYVIWAESVTISKIHLEFLRVCKCNRWNQRNPWLHWWTRRGKHKNNPVDPILDGDWPYEGDDRIE